MRGHSRTSRSGGAYGRGIVNQCLLILMVAGIARASDNWVRLEDDGIHDPNSPAIKVLQQPAEALSLLPPDNPGVGNQVRWVEALREGFIEPRTHILPGTKIETLDLDIVMKGTGDANWVLFPHQPHTEWLDCSNCHEEIFALKTGETPMTMFAILSGQYCGRCHGAVSFPLTECNRCHSVAPVEPSPGEAVPHGSK